MHRLGYAGLKKIFCASPCGQQHIVRLRIAGVHSLATVVAFKMECDPNAFAEDPEGVAIATVSFS